MSELSSDEPSIAAAGPIQTGARPWPPEARGAPQCCAGGTAPDKFGIERGTVPQDADRAPSRPVPLSYPVPRLIKNMIAKTTEGIIEVGRSLIAIKQQLDHGQFIDWVEMEVGISKRTAQSYMAIARLFETKGATVALLPPTTAHRLAGISAPVEVVDHVLDRAGSGQIVPVGEVDEMLKNARKQRKEAKKKDRRSRAASKGAYRRSEAGRRKEELCRLEREHERRRSQEEASRIAADLIQQLGSAGATRVVELMSSDMAHDVLAELRKQLPDGVDSQSSCGAAPVGASP